MFGFIIKGLCYSLGITVIFFKNNIYTKTREFKQLMNLVRTQYPITQDMSLYRKGKNRLQIIRISIYMVLQSWYIEIIKYIPDKNKNIIQLDKNNYEITYKISDNTYKFVVKRRKGPKKVLNITNEDGKNINNLVFSYMGPQEDFHGIDYTPSFFKQKELIFDMSDGSKKRYNKDQQIII